MWSSMYNLNVTTLTHHPAVCALQGGVSTVMAGFNFSKDVTDADAQESRGSASLNATMPNLTMLNPLAATGMGMLESFIPQYSLFASVVRDVLGLDLGMVMAVCLALYSFWGTAQYLYSMSWDFVASHYTAQITIRDEDEIYQHVMAWLHSQRLTTHNTRLTAETNYELPENEEWDTNSDGFINFTSWWRRSVPRFAPAHGSHWFKHGGRYFEFTRSRRDIDELNPWGSGRSRSEETVVISCLGRSTDPIKKLLVDCKDAYYAKEITNTDILRPTAGAGCKSWDPVASRRSRPIETVVLDAKQKQEVLEDMDEFLRPATATWYAERGIPYRRGYLFHGPPGTGKTSLSFAAAGLFGLDVYCLSLVDPTMNEEDLVSLFSQLPSRCIVLLEDVDTAGLAKRTGLLGADAKKEASKSKSKSSKKGADSDDSDDEDNLSLPDRAAKRGSGITLSGLLNAIDGVASHEGRLLVMTTNKPSALDAALRRPGRVDKEVAFTHASRGQIADLFERMYAGHPDASRELAGKFAALLEDGVWSPAEIQGFLLTHKKEPRTAVAEVDKWRLEQLEGKKSDKEKREEKEKKDAEEKKRLEEEERRQRYANEGNRPWAVPWIAAF